MVDDIFERVVFHKEKTFLKENTESTDAFIVQSGTVTSYVVKNNYRIDVGTYEVGDIIAESNLLLDEKLALNYEAATKVTLVKINRHDFQKKMGRIEPQISKVIKHMADKLMHLQLDKINNALNECETDNQAREIVDHLLRDMDDDRKTRYEDILLPHFNVMVKALDELKREDRYKRQKEHAKKIQKDILSEESAE